VLILGVAFLALQPTVSSNLIPQKRQLLLTTFLNQVNQDQHISAQKFWEFREFYSPGTFTFNSESVGVYQTFRIINLPTPQTDLIFFTAPKTKSLDAVINSPRIYLDKISSISEPVFQNSSSVIYYNTQSSLKIIFYKSIDEMRSANGFFDYLPSELEFLDGKYWLNETELRLD